MVFQIIRRCFKVFYLNPYYYVNRYIRVFQTTPKSVRSHFLSALCFKMLDSFEKSPHADSSTDIFVSAGVKKGLIAFFSFSFFAKKNYKTSTPRCLHCRRRHRLSRSFQQKKIIINKQKKHVSKVTCHATCVMRQKKKFRKKVKTFIK